MASGYPPALLAGIIAAAKRYGVPADVLIATTLVEAPGSTPGSVRLDAVGDNGQSFGPFQEYTGGRGAGLTPAQREDPAGAADRAGREFAIYQAKGLKGGALAAAAQRPADPAGYAAKVDSNLPVARRILKASIYGPAMYSGGTLSGLKSIPGDAAAVATGAASAAGGAVSALNPLNAVGAVTDFVKNFALKILAFLLLGVIGVWLISQGASRAFGTPTVGQVAKSAPVPIPV